MPENPSRSGRTSVRGPGHRAGIAPPRGEARHPGRLVGGVGDPLDVRPALELVEPLLDVLVHAQDVVRPLDLVRPMPPDAAATAARRAWSMGFPFHARRRLGPVRLVATDHAWSIGEGSRTEEVRGAVGDLLLLVTGRDVVLPDLEGPGAGALLERLVSR